MKLFRLKCAVAVLIITISLFDFRLKAQIITTIAGDSAAGCYLVNGNSTTSCLSHPYGIVTDGIGNLYFSDASNNQIRKIDNKGNLTTIAGNGIAGFSGDGNLAINASLNHPEYITIDKSKNIYVADSYNRCIRKISNNGIITTVAGNGQYGYTGDGGLAISCSMYGPSSVDIDTSGNLYIADNSRIRKVDKNGIITTIAGNGKNSYSGDGDSAILASFFLQRILVDNANNIYLTDPFNNCVRKINSNGIISTVAGNGNIGYNGDSILATKANLSFPTDIAIDKQDNLYITEVNGSRVRKVDVNGIISTVAGNGIQGYSGDGGLATLATLSGSYGVAVDTFGNLYIADNGRYIRKVTYGTLPIKLSDINETQENKTISINWHTSNELNTSHFGIQHSADGTSFTDIGTVKAIGSGANSYSFTDTHPSNGTNYYRLQSVDRDGASSFSKVVSVQFTVDRLPFTVVPNPARDIVTVKGSHIALVQVIDNLGRVVKTVTFKDATNPTLSVSALPTGVYRLRIQTTDGNVSGVGMVKE